MHYLTMSQRHNSINLTQSFKSEDDGKNILKHYASQQIQLYATQIATELVTAVVLVVMSYHADNARRQAHSEIRNSQQFPLPTYQLLVLAYSVSEHFYGGMLR